MAEQPEDKPVPETGADLPFGEELRRQREMRDVSVREISETTKISTRFLEAIETGDLSSLPAPVFTRGFIREYATYLGLDPEDIVDRYMSVVAREERKREHEEEEMRDRISGRLPVGPGTPAFKWIVIAIVALVVLGAGIWLATSGETDPGTVPAEQAASEESSEPVAPEPATDTAATVADSIQMILTASSDSWIDLQVDDQPPTDFTLQAGGSRTFEAESRILIRTVGNAGGVTVELNGMQARPLGRTNQVVRNVEYDLARVNEMLQQTAVAPAENRSE